MYWLWLRGCKNYYASWANLLEPPTRMTTGMTTLTFFCDAQQKFAKLPFLEKPRTQISGFREGKQDGPMKATTQSNKRANWGKRKKRKWKKSEVMRNATKTCELSSEVRPRIGTRLSSHCARLASVRHSLGHGFNQTLLCAKYIP